jgi:crotonobetainyl-CoA:carnitine CoA-transferase CaiB-like acyl-CoA transferase
VDASRISPALGAHNETVYAALGIAEETLAELKEKHII